MVILQTVLEALYSLLGFALLVMLLYQLYLTCFGFRRDTVDYKPHKPKARFLILVPAHNEEAVIGDIVDNLNRMDYPLQ